MDIDVLAYQVEVNIFYQARVLQRHGNINRLNLVISDDIDYVLTVTKYRNRNVVTFFSYLNSTDSYFLDPGVFVDTVIKMTYQRATTDQ